MSDVLREFLVLARTQVCEYVVLVSLEAGSQQEIIYLNFVLIYVLYRHVYCESKMFFLCIMGIHTKIPVTKIVELQLVQTSLLVDTFYWTFSWPIYITL